MNRYEPEQVYAMIEDWSRLFLNSPANDLGFPNKSPEKAFGLPLIGIASGDDNYWKIIKKIIPNHFSPNEAFKLAYQNEAPAYPRLSVIVWIIPQTEATLEDQRQSTGHPCERWVRSRYYGQQHVIDKMAEHIIGQLKTIGIRAVAPDGLPKWKYLKNEMPLASPWSHRHAAYAAGLGTFGLCDGLITPLGKAVRLLSLIADTALPVTPRKYSKPYEYCLYFNSGKCGACLARCPAGAISKEKGHDKAKCQHFLANEAADFAAKQWPDIKGAAACGLCQSKVPCERKIPGK